MPILAAETLLRKNKKIDWQNVTPSGNRTILSTLTLTQTETLGSIYSDALLIGTESSKSKSQVVHECKFKDLLSSKCQRRVLDLESEVMSGPSSIPTRGNIFYWIFCFHVVKTSDGNIGIIANFV